jgi:hypothetical protein
MAKSGVAKLVLSLCLLASVATAGGVYATWQLAEPYVPSQSNNVDLGVNEFMWAPEEILPDKEPIGESHIELIKLLIDVNSSRSLNYAKSTLNGAIDKRLDRGKQTIGSMGVVQGGNLKHIFTTSQTRALEFLIQMVSDTVYYVYTFTDADLNAANEKEGVTIDVYKTYLEKTDGIWVATHSEAGSARTALYDADQGKQSLSIDHTSYQKS